MREDTGERDFTRHPPEVMDRVTFTTGRGSLLAGYVAAICPHPDPGNGQYVAWVELEGDGTGDFNAVALNRIVHSDNDGENRRRRVDAQLWRRLALCHFGGDAKDGASM